MNTNCIVRAFLCVIKFSMEPLFEGVDERVWGNGMSAAAMARRSDDMYRSGDDGRATDTSARSYTAASSASGDDMSGDTYDDDDEDSESDVVDVFSAQMSSSAAPQNSIGSRSDDIIEDNLHAHNAMPPREGETQVVRPLKSRARRTARSRARHKSARSKFDSVDLYCSLCGKHAGVKDDLKSGVVLFKCQHSFHISCYHDITAASRGTVCPECHKTSRYDHLMDSKSDTRSLSSVIGALNNNNYECALMCNASIDSHEGDRIWQSLLRLGAVPDATRNPSDKLWRSADPHNDYELHSRAYLRSVVSERSSEKVRDLIERGATPDEISGEVDAFDIMNSGCTIDSFLAKGYTLEDIYSMGIRDWVQVLKLGANVHHLQRTHLNHTDCVPFAVDTLVNQYGMTYKSLITFIASRKCGHQSPSPEHYRRAVWEFCAIGFTDVEIQQLGLNSISGLFMFGGQKHRDRDERAVTIAAFVDLCTALDVSLHEAKQLLKFDAQLLLELGIRAKHLGELGWEPDEIERELGHDFLDRMHESEQHEQKRLRDARRNRRQTRSPIRAARRTSSSRRRRTSDRTPDRGSVSDADATRTTRRQRHSVRSSTASHSAASAGSGSDSRSSRRRRVSRSTRMRRESSSGSDDEMRAPVESDSSESDGAHTSDSSSETDESTSDDDDDDDDGHGAASSAVAVPSRSVNPFSRSASAQRASTGASEQHAAPPPASSAGDEEISSYYTIV